MSHLFKCFFCIPVLFSFASPLPLSDGQQQYTKECIGAIINGDYDTALAVADSIMRADTADPLPSLLRLTALGVRNIDFDSLLDSAEFLSSYRTTERRILCYEKTHGVSSYTTTLSGFCKGFHSAFFLREKSYFAAMRNGFKSLGLLEESYDLDTTNADPLFLLGLYEYAKGELKHHLWWVLFWYPGSKKTGVERLQTCMTKGHFAAAAAAFALAEIYVREKKPDNCAPLVEALARDFPKSRFTLWAKAKYLESRRLFYEAGQAYELLAASYGATPVGGYNAYLTRSLQAQMLLKAGQNRDAADSCRALLRQTPVGREIQVYHDTKKLLERINERERQ